MMRPMMRATWMSCLVALAACGGGDDGGVQTTLFPAAYAASYVKVRPCRPSADHDLNNVTVLVDPDAVSAYMARDRPFPTGSVVVKAEYDFGDTDCTGPITLWTVMVQLPAGSAPSTIDWHWQKIDANRDVTTDNEPRCIGCHTTCGGPPDGYAGTCSAP
ncbi:MAG: cytochrome P460 family protein [Kofleriaceae bacterium]